MRAVGGWEQRRNVKMRGGCRGWLVRGGGGGWLVALAFGVVVDFVVVQLADCKVSHFAMLLATCHRFAVRECSAQ